MCLRVCACVCVYVWCIVTGAFHTHALMMSFVAEIGIDDGKLVVVGDAALLAAGAGIAIVKDKAGKNAILVNAKHVAKSGITLSDALLKIARID